ACACSPTGATSPTPPPGRACRASPSAPGPALELAGVRPRGGGARRPLLRARLGDPAGGRGARAPRARWRAGGLGRVPRPRGARARPRGDRVGLGAADRGARAARGPRRRVRALGAPRDRRERRSEEHTSELQSRENLVCRLLLEKKKILNTQRMS